MSLLASEEGTEKASLLSTEFICLVSIKQIDSSKPLLHKITNMSQLRGRPTVTIFLALNRLCVCACIMYCVRV